MVDPRTLIVVPTLGTRLRLLEQCLESILTQEVPVDIVMVGPEASGLVDVVARHRARLLPDPGSLPAAINVGVAQAQASHDYVNWLGDDDLLEPDSLRRTISALDDNPDAVLAYGACRYIDDAGAPLWVNRAGPWATRILKWGPDLIPQPGMLVRRSAWDAVGGVDETMRFAFDLDLLLKIQPLGRFVDVGEIVSSFRWHADSLTVGDREASLEESELARRRALSPTMRRLAWIWERPVRLATRVAAREVSRRATRASVTRALT